ncbi:ninja-family protein 6-like [Andrographis paniculata]|uniref:ninja-family protein 6-like n=1 Tax=Andrographis paniculata TaxID=175694 RepID=UPI0021E8689A|nr:ninja-family protein 6-like [Andrographis paniculata]
MESGDMRSNNFEYRNSSVVGGDSRNAEAEAQADGGIELSLGLSTNGRFGVDRSTEGFRRSSSVSDLHSNGFSCVNGVSFSASGSGAPLVRVSSVPTETDERPQTEVQARRSAETRGHGRERIHDVNGLREGNSSSSQLTESGFVNGIENLILGQPSSSPSQGLILIPPTSAAGIDPDTIEALLLQGADTYTAGNSSSSPPNPLVEVVEGLLNGAPVTPSSPGFDAPDVQAPFGINAHPVQPAGNRNSAPVVSITGNDFSANSDALPAGEIANNRPNQNGNMIQAVFDMPYVSTRGYGPNCPKIAGILYRYRSRNDLKIVCVCHGMFLSPAEFVKHGGGSEVAAAQPLRHIVVVPFPFP